MRDGKTRKRVAAASGSSLQRYLDRFQAKIVLVSGSSAGVGFALDRERMLLGRGPGVDRAFDDTAMSRQHASIEFCDGKFQLRDLGSTNGVSVNGRRVQSAELQHGDRFEIGGQRFMVSIEERVADEAYELTS